MALESRKGKTNVAATPAAARTKTVTEQPVVKTVLTTAPAPLPPLFGQHNYILMLAGALVILLGMFLMSGGQNESAQFEYDKVYSTTRITIAPLLILLGFGIEIYAIFKRKPADKQVTL